MNKIWARRLVYGDKTWNDVPSARKNGVKTELKKYVTDKEINEEQYEEIVGEPYND